MKRKWVKRSDVIILLIIIMYFTVIAWGMVMATIQILRGDYSTIAGEVIMAACTGIAAVIAWLIKNMSESNTKNKLNPEYLKQDYYNEGDGGA